MKIILLTYQGLSWFFSSRATYLIIPTTNIFKVTVWIKDKEMTMK